MAILIILDAKSHKDKPLGERLRLALQELGPDGSSSGKCYQPAAIFFRRILRSAGVIAGQSRSV